MSNINDTTASLVNAAMAESKTSQVEIHEKTGIARSSLQRKLSGLSKFTIDELYAIAKALGIKTRELIPEQILNEDAAEETTSERVA